jgi:hypothetical protein
VGTIPQIHLADEHTPDPRTISHHMGAALEASCETLLTLQLLASGDGTKPADPSAFQLQVAQATESLRRSIGELRMAYEDHAGVLTLGFVVSAPNVTKPRPRRKLSLKTAPNSVDSGLDPAG